MGAHLNNMSVALSNTEDVVIVHIDAYVIPGTEQAFFGVIVQATNGEFFGSKK